MDHTIVWTDRAERDLEEIVRFVATDSPTAAATLRDDLLESVEILARFPYIGPVYERDRSGRSREILCHRYRIFYRVRETERRVEIITVWHSSRQEPNLRGGSLRPNRPS